MTREPGGSDGAEKIRDLLLSGPEERWSAKGRSAAFRRGARGSLRGTIEPALTRGRWVICDRFVDSSLAYQGGAGALGIEKVRELNGWAIGDGFPDRTLILILEEGADRARARDTDGSDRIGGRGADYHQRVDLAFRMIAAEEPERVRLIDASGSPDRNNGAPSRRDRGPAAVILGQPRRLSNFECLGTAQASSRVAARRSQGRRQGHVRERRGSASAGGCCGATG